MNEQNQKPHLERDHTGRAWIACGNQRFLAFKSERRIDAEVEAGHWVSNVSRSGLEPVIVMERPECGNFGCFMGDEVLFCGIRWACESYAEGWNAVFSEAVAA